jgi:hypothetical protein
LIAEKTSMNQAELNRAVAEATGETVATIAKRGFTLLTSTPVEREPLVMDWDTYDDHRRVGFARLRLPEPATA